MMLFKCPLFSHGAIWSQGKEEELGKVLDQLSHSPFTFMDEMTTESSSGSDIWDSRGTWLGGSYFRSHG
jgi:hypothetical protein